MELGLPIIIGKKEYRGECLGEESLYLLVQFAFNVLNLRKITALVFSDNDKAIKMYDKWGFNEEWFLKEEIFKEGKFKDIVVMCLFRGENKYE